MRIVPVLALALAVTSGCGAAAESGVTACTAIGVLTGIGVDVPPRPGQTIGYATLQACWNGVCRTWPVELYPSTAPGAQTCTGTAPDDSCSVKMAETGGRQGFVDIPDLPAGPIQVTVTVTDPAGTEIARTEQNTAARLVYPNGPECGGGGPQLNVVVR